MAAKSTIEWTGSTWNPVTGCTKVSPGCMNCYAERMAKRLKAMGQPNYANGFELSLHEHVLEIPLQWKKSQTIFVNSMSDLFHEQVPFDFIKKAFDIMHRAYWHKFQVLTKRSERLLDLDKHLDWKENIWMGVSVESESYTNRIDHLRKTHASIKFLSIEPLLGPLHNLDLSGIDWVIVGGESGPGSRPMLLNWVVDIRDQCLSADIPFFFKQWGGVNKKKAGRSLEGRTWDEIPKELALPKNKSFGEAVTIEPFPKRSPGSEGQKSLRI
jgi:protein gp37